MQDIISNPGAMRPDNTIKLARLYGPSTFHDSTVAIPTPDHLVRASSPLLVDTDVNLLGRVVSPKMRKNEIVCVYYEQLLQSNPAAEIPSESDTHKWTQTVKERSRALAPPLKDN
jgi:hypothetical protein